MMRWSEEGGEERRGGKVGEFGKGMKGTGKKSEEEAEEKGREESRGR